MSTYCRITGKSRGLPKPNYFPLLPPISPADAKRLCRITGKSYGLPTHHYIPVLVGFASKKAAVRSSGDKISSCHITGKADLQEAHHYYPGSGGVQHTVLKEYKYIFPKWETSVDLTKILQSKNTTINDDDSSRYVYTVDERKCGLVFPAGLEAAVRDGDVSDVMLAKTADTLLFKLRRGGQSVEVDVEEMSIVDGMILYEGEGPSEQEMMMMLQKRKKRKRINNEWRRKIFEDKERVADDEDEKLSSEKQRSKRMKVIKLSAIGGEIDNANATAAAAELANWNAVHVADNNNAIIGTSSMYVVDAVRRQTAKGELNSLVGHGKTNRPEIISAMLNRLPEPINNVIKVEEVDLSVSIPGIIQQPNIDFKDIVVGLPVIMVFEPFKPLVTSGFNGDISHAIKSINENKGELAKMAEAESRFKDIDVLPKIEEITRVVEQIQKATLTCSLSDVMTTMHQINGLAVTIGGVENGVEKKRFVPGEIIETSSGLVFIPGGTLTTSSGDISFVPGFKVNNTNGEAKFLPGQIVQYGADDENTTDGQSSWIFVAGQTVLTRDGEKFVQGQEVSTGEGVKFLPGQTVITSNGPAFVPGQIVENVDATGSFKFVPGQVVSCSDGAHFVPGQFSVVTSVGAGNSREAVFIPGKSILNEDYEWEFIPGQAVKTTDGKTVFVPGITTVIDNERSFIPGLVSKSDTEEEYFVPGVIVNNENGSSAFVPGVNIASEEGQKFVEGLVIKDDNGEYSFVAGRISKTDEVTGIDFERATKIEDIILRDVADFGLLADDVLFRENGSSFLSSAAGNNEIFGHMVQSSVGVEFFPGDDVVGLPAGKVVPGRLVRGKEIRFIPGNMVAEKFVPGQIVITDKGEQFVPGQVIETNEGPKFVPGQVLETKTGPKFVPGQTVQTDDGPRFIPGQIVNTKAGPTFIPGQVIFTEEEGPRFVPGQVVDTVEGPRFVPGKVVETGDRVTFIPGQIVETEDGLKFIAPDLEDDPEGGCQFTVQGFEITPEELKMLQRNSISHALFNSFEAEPAIDSTMLRQLASAGMAIGREVPVEVPAIDIKSSPITEAACRVGEKLNVDMYYSVKLSHIFSNIRQLVLDLNDDTISGRFSLLEQCEDDNLKILLNAVNEFSGTGDSRHDILTALADIMVEIVAVEPDRKLQIIDLLHETSTELVTKIKMRKPVSKLTVLRQLVRNNNINNINNNNNINNKNHHRKFDKDAISTLVSILPDEEYAVSSAFQHICQESPELIDKVFADVGEMLRNGQLQEDKVTEMIHRAIIRAVVEASEHTVQRVLDKADGEEFKCLVLDAIGLAKALGMTDIANALVGVLSDAKSVEILAGDRITLEVLKRLTIMRQLAGKRPHLGRALNELKLDPYSARKDPRLKELVRESAALMVVPEESLLFKSSDDIPASLLFGDNSLVVEDFIVRTRRHGSIFLILKRGLQAVIPREAAKSVLTGKVSYTVLDENGIHYFKPLHVFNALKLSRFATDRFSMYGYAPQIVKNKKLTDDDLDDDRIIIRGDTMVSFEDVRKNFENGCSLTEEGSGEEFIVVKDFFEERDDDGPEFYLDKGENVKVLNTDDDDPTLSKIYRAETLTNAVGCYSYYSEFKKHLTKQILSVRPAVDSNAVLFYLLLVAVLFLGFLLFST